MSSTLYFDAHGQPHHDPITAFFHSIELPEAINRGDGR